MKLSSLRATLLAGTVALACVLGAACESTTTVPKEKDDPPEEVANPNLPNANDAITFAHVFGESGRSDVVRGMDADGEGGYYYLGLSNGYFSLGRINANGAPQWSQRVRYAPRDMQALGPEAAYAGLIGVGAFDSDSDGGSDLGYVTVFSPNGTPVDEMLFSDEAADVWLNAVAPLSDSTFVVVGGRRSGGTTHPFIARVGIAADGTLIGYERTALTDPAGTVFVSIIGSGAIEPGPRTQLFAVGHELVAEGGQSDNVTAHGLTIDPAMIEDVTLDWSRDIVVYPGLETDASTGRSIAYDNGRIFIAGQTDDPKEPRPAGDGWWHSGFVAAVSSAGEVHWIRTVNLSEYSDDLLGVHVSGGTLYAAGQYSWFHNIPTNRNFGYGLLSKFNPITGEAIAHMTFGDESYSSGFCEVRMVSGEARCAGWTRYGTSGDGYQCWFAGVQVSDGALLPAASAGRDAVGVRVSRVDTEAPEPAWRSTR